MQARLPLPETDAQIRRVLLTGASGLVGGHVLKRLLASGEPFEVVAPTRAPLMAQSPRLRNIVYDSSTAERRTDSGLRRSLAGLKADVWICALGTTIGKAGNQAAFVAVERGLAEQNFPRVDILRPGLLLGERGERRPGERLAQGLAPLYNPLLMGPLARFRAIEADAVAAAAVSLARDVGSGWFVHEYASLRKLADR